MHVQAHVHTKQPEPGSWTGLCLSLCGCMCPGVRLFSMFVYMQIFVIKTIS